MNSTGAVSNFNVQLVYFSDLLIMINLYMMAYLNPITIFMTLLTNVVSLALLAAPSKSLGLSSSMHLYYVAIAVADLCTVFASHLWGFLGTNSERISICFVLFCTD